MADISAPTTPSPPFYIGKGLTDGTDVVTIFGYPLPNSGDMADELSPPFDIVDETTLFDLSGLTIDHEVVVALYKYPNNVTSNTYITIKFKNLRTNQTLFTYSSTVIASSENPQGISPIAWIGWCDTEIAENGYYSVQFILTGGANVNVTGFFAVTGIPAYLHLYNYDVEATSFIYTLGLSKLFDEDNYIGVGVCTSNFTDGQSSAPSGILDYINAPSSASGAAVVGEVTGLSPGTAYTIYGFAQAANGNYYHVGSSRTITTDPLSAFAWTYSGWDIVNNVPVTGSIKSSTYRLYVTAAEWNALIAKVRDTYAVKGFSSYTPTMTAATPDTDMLTSQFNQVKNAIGWLYNNNDPPAGIGIPDKTKDTYDILATDFNVLRTKINDIA